MLEPVNWSAELGRILALPRRPFNPADHARLKDILSPLLLTEAGSRTEAALRPIQAFALDEASRAGGLFAAISVGGGKTLTSWLLPTVFDARRPLLLLPAKLVEKTRIEFGKLAKDWVSPPRPYRIESYTQLTLAKSAQLIEEYQPDLIVCDEAHKLRNAHSSTAKRIGRYIRSSRKAGKTIYFAALTGTILRKSLRDFSHILEWCLGTGAPIPLHYLDLEEWADALDENVDSFNRRTVGALVRLIQPDQPRGGDALTTVREGFRRRLIETPGVVCTDESSCDQPLVIRYLEAPDDPELDAAFERFRMLWETPDGWPLSDPLSVYRHALELACGFFYKWDPRPPQPWIQARRDWCGFVRDEIQSSGRSRRPLDTEFQVAQAYPDEHVTRAWRDIRDTFRPNSVPQWLTGTALSYANEWHRALQPGLIWVQHNACGESAAKLCGLKYYGAGGLDSTGQSIERAPRGKSAVVSIASNGEGRNLQGWSRNLVLSTPQAATAWEQLLGRTHRDGQHEPVLVDILVSCLENITAVEAAQREAQFVRQTQGHTQKLLLAQWEHWDGPRNKQSYRYRKIERK